MSCTENCWAPANCPKCGDELPPRGRDIEYLSRCCDTYQNSVMNLRHLWDIHDSNRIYTDPSGWKNHQLECKDCQ